MHRRSTLPILALALAPWVAGAARAQGADTSSHPISFQPPTAVAGFRMTGHEVLQEPGAGAHLRYQRPGAAEWIDVYVYPVPGDSTCTAGCDSLAVRREADQFAGMIPELLRRGYYDSLRVADDHRVSLPTGGRTLAGRHLLLKGGREGRRITSHFYLVAAGEVLVKLRATYPPDAPMDAALDEFAKGFVDAALRTVNACAGGQPEGNGVSMRVQLDSPLTAVRPRVQAVLERLGYTVEAGRDTWATQTVREWPARELWGLMRAFAHPGVQVMVQAHTEAGKTELVVSARTVCRIPDHRDFENTVPLIAAMEVTAEFSDAKKP